MILLRKPAQLLKLNNRYQELTYLLNMMTKYWNCSDFTVHFSLNILLSWLQGLLYIYNIIIINAERCIQVTVGEYRGCILQQYLDHF